MAALDKGLTGKLRHTTSVLPRRKMSNGRHESTCCNNHFSFFMVLAGPHLSSLIALINAAPADEYTLAMSTPHKLNGSHKAWHWISISSRQ